MNTKLLFFSVSIISIIILLAVFSYEAPQKMITQEDNRSEGTPVSFMSVSAQSYPINIKAFGSVTPLWQTNLRSQIDGTITYINPKLQPGNKVTKGTLLLQVDTRPYKAEVAEAKGRLAHANVAYLKAQNEANEAKKNWRRSGLKGQPSSELVFRKPQLNAAQADIQSATDAIIYAQKRLEDTNITAPYHGVITSRVVDIGESVFAGDDVATLFADARVEIPIKLDLFQWNQLPKALQEAQVIIIEPRLQTQWHARIKRLGQTLDAHSGLRTLYLEVDSPLEKRPPLLPGMFVEAHIKGKSYDNLLQLPETALTKRSYVWYIDDSNLLRSFKAKAIFYKEGDVFVKAPPQSKTLRIAIKPNNSFVNAKRVSPVEQR